MLQVYEKRRTSAAILAVVQAVTAAVRWLTSTASRSQGRRACSDAEGAGTGGGAADADAAFRLAADLFLDTCLKQLSAGAGSCGISTTGNGSGAGSGNVDHAGAACAAAVNKTGNGPATASGGSYGRGTSMRACSRGALQVTECWAQLALAFCCHPLGIDILTGSAAGGAGASAAAAASSSGSSAGSDLPSLFVAALSSLPSLGPCHGAQAALLTSAALLQRAALQEQWADGSSSGGGGASAVIGAGAALPATVLMDRVKGIRVRSAETQGHRWQSLRSPQVLVT